MKNIKHYLPGAFIILLALLIIAVPEILFAMVAGLLVMIGLGVLYAGHLVRKSELRIYSADPWNMAETFFYKPLNRSRFVRVWYRDF